LSPKREYRVEMMNGVKALRPFLALLAAAGLLVGGVIVLTRDGETVSAPPEDSPRGEAARSIPPIDAAAPDGFETATFALG
jgi:hypothetical protein